MLSITIPAVHSTLYSLSVSYCAVKGMKDAPAPQSSKQALSFELPIHTSLLSAYLLSIIYSKSLTESTS